MLVVWYLIVWDVEDSSRLTKSSPLKLAQKRFSSREYDVLKGKQAKSPFLPSSLSSQLLKLLRISVDLFFGQEGLLDFLYDQTLIFPDLLDLYWSFRLWGPNPVFKSKSRMYDKRWWILKTSQLNYNRMDFHPHSSFAGSKLIIFSSLRLPKK